MDDGSTSNPLHSKYLDPQCSALSMLADVATQLDDRDASSSIPCHKIRFHLNPMKTVRKGVNDEALKTHGLLKEEAFNSKKHINLDSKKPIKFMGSAFEASLNLKFHLHLKKTVKNNADEVLKEDRFPNEEAASKKPINFMGIEEGATSNADLDFKDDDILIKNNKRSALKGKHAAFINDADNVDVLEQEWVLFESSSKKKEKKSTSSSNKRQRLNALEGAPSELPQEFKDKINEMGGNEITLLITKSLFDSDLKAQQNRLSIPLKQIENTGFLREGELNDLEEKKSIQVTLIQPSLELTNVTLVKWNMPKKNGIINSSYVLRSSSWMEVTKANQLKVMDRVQVWSFRVQEELYMAVVKV